MAGKVFLFLLIVIASKSIEVNSLKLKQVLVLSRHNVRTPLTGNLEKLSPKKWPKWDGNSGELTRKGSILEEYMGEYFSAWLRKEGLLSENCPEGDTVYIYANTKQRTKESAKSFVRGAFKNCNIIVHHLNTETMDPVFNPIVRNNTDAFKDVVIKDMQNKIDDINLEDAFEELNNIIDFKNSDYCKVQKVCNLAEGKNNIFYEVGAEPNLLGPLAIGNAAVDAFMMAYYDGMPLSNVAWGKISRPEQWKLLMQINGENHNVRFNNTVIAKDAAKLIINYIRDKLLDENAPKFTLLVGHDSNFFTVMSALGFKAYDLPDQYEKTPIGGKLVFQKFVNESSGEEFLRINYVYQTTDQLRDGTKLSLENSPKWVTMSIAHCETNEEGFCAWNDFITVLENV